MANPVQINDALHTDAVTVGGVLTGVVSAQDARSSLAALVAHDGAGPRLGIFYEGNPTLVTGTATTSPSMQVSVAPLAFCGQKALAEGVYIGRSTGTVLVDVAAAPASNSRYDVVYVMERDLHSNSFPDGLTQGEIGVVTGTAAVSPTKPAIPVGAVEVATLTVAAGATKTTDPQVTITTTWGWTTAAGSPIPVPNQTTRDGLTPFDGLRVYRLDLHTIDTYSGGSWGWTAYTPTVKSNGVAVTLAAGAVTGRYMQIGKTVHYIARFTLGAGTTFNSAGAITISLPTAPGTPATRTGFGSAVGIIAGAVFSRLVRLLTGYDVLMVDMVDNQIASTTGAWASGNYAEIYGTYDVV